MATIRTDRAFRPAFAPGGLSPEELRKRKPFQPAPFKGFARLFPDTQNPPGFPPGGDIIGTPIDLNPVIIGGDVQPIVGGVVGGGGDDDLDEIAKKKLLEELDKEPPDLSAILGDTDKFDFLADQDLLSKTTGESFTDRFKEPGSPEFDFSIRQLLRPDAITSLGAAPGVGSEGSFVDRFVDPTKGGERSFVDRFQESEAGSEDLFQDLLGNIDAPSTIDEVRREVESERLSGVLEDIDSDFASQRALDETSFFERGIRQPGATSDIAENALAQLEGDRIRTRGGERSKIALAEIERLKERERAKTGAFSKRFDVGAQRDSQLLDIFARGQEGEQERKFGRDTQLRDIFARGQEGEQERGLTRDLTRGGFQQERDITQSGNRLKSILAAAGISGDRLNQLTSIIGRGTQADQDRDFDREVARGGFEQENRGQLADIKAERDKELARLLTALSTQGNSIQFTL